MTFSLRKLLRGAMLLDASLVAIALLAGGSAVEWFIIALLVGFSHLVLYFVRR